MTPLETSEYDTIYCRSIFGIVHNTLVVVMENEDTTLAFDFRGTKIYRAKKFAFIEMTKHKPILVKSEEAEAKRQKSFNEKAELFMDYWLKKSCWFYTEHSDKKSEIDPDLYYDLTNSFQKFTLSAHKKNSKSGTENFTWN